MKIAQLRVGIVIAFAAGSCAAAGPSRDAGFGRLALNPFLLKARGGGPTKVVAKNDEETAGRSVGAPMAQKVNVTKDELPLVEDIDYLSGILAETVNRVNPKIHDVYTKFRQYGLKR